MFILNTLYITLVEKVSKDEYFALTVIITEYAPNGSLSDLIKHDRMNLNKPILINFYTLES